MANYTKIGSKSERLESQIIELLKQKTPFQEIIEKLNVSRPTIRKIAEINDLFYKTSKSMRLEAQVLELLKQEIPHSVIGRKLDANAATIRKIAKANNILYKKANSKSFKLEAQVIELLNQKFPISEIHKKLNLNLAAIGQIAKAHNIIPKKLPREMTERNEQICKLILEGEAYPIISKKFNVTKQRIHQIAKIAHVSSRTEKKKIYIHTFDQINQDLENGSYYKDIIQKYDPILLRKTIWNANRKNLNANVSPDILSIKKQAELSNRNKTITQEFSKGRPASSIVQDISPDAIINPKKLININSVYRLCRLRNSQRYPQIKNRNKGETSESFTILKLIVELKEKDKLSFERIARHLNATGRMTIAGKIFAAPNTRVKYLIAKKKGL